MPRASFWQSSQSIAAPNALLSEHEGADWLINPMLAMPELQPMLNSYLTHCHSRLLTHGLTEESLDRIATALSN